MRWPWKSTRNKVVAFSFINCKLQYLSNEFIEAFIFLSGFLFSGYAASRFSNSSFFFFAERSLRINDIFFKRRVYYRKIAIATIPSLGTWYKTKVWYYIFNLIMCSYLMLIGLWCFRLWIFPFLEVLLNEDRIFWSHLTASFYFSPKTIDIF